jgi:hypothetical protein
LAAGHDLLPVIAHDVTAPPLAPRWRVTESPGTAVYEAVPTAWRSADGGEPLDQVTMAAVDGNRCVL